jgi:hypothetical protein
LFRVVLDSLGVQHLPVVFAHIQVLGVVLGQQNLLSVIAQLEVCNIVLLLGLRLDLALLLALLLLLLQLLGGLLGLAGEIAGADLAAEDTGLGPIPNLDAQSYLLQNKLDLLAAGHGPKGLDLELAEGGGGALEIALGLLDVGEDLCHASPLDLDKDLTLGDSAQGLDDGQLGIEVGGVVEEAHDGLDHFCDGLFELAMLLGKDQGLVAEERPVPGILADGDDGDEDS